jgi:hypothetical protein
MSANLVFHAPTKHIEVHNHFARERERVVRKLIEIEYISTKDQMADSFPKALVVRPFEMFNNNLNL